MTYSLGNDGTTTNAPVSSTANQFQRPVFSSATGAAAAGTIASHTIESGSEYAMMAPYQHP